jgi:hypothetical protein
VAHDVQAGAAAQQLVVGAAHDAHDVQAGAAAQQLAAGAAHDAQDAAGA